MKKIGILAPSSVVSFKDLSLGAERLRSWGAQVEISPQVKKQKGIFAGSDELRAQTLFEFAHREDLDIIWSARGGYGANHLLPQLDAFEKKFGRPKKKKIYVGYSDATAVLAYVRERWGWKTIHGVMPGHASFLKLKKSESELLRTFVGLSEKTASRDFSVKMIYSPKQNRAVREAPLVGGNLAVWNALTGTAYQPKVLGKWLFFEDLAENPSRLDRMVQQLIQAGGFKGCEGVILGDFTDCEDSPPTDSQGKTLRQKLSLKKALYEMFSDVGRIHDIPVYSGLPVGHGPSFFPLVLGGVYRLSQKPTGSKRLQCRFTYLGDK